MALLLTFWLALHIPILAVLFGVVEFPLPYPATNEKVVDVAADKIPKPRPFEGVLAKNELLKKAHLLTANVSGAESVTMAPDGSLYVLDKFAHVFRLTPRSCCGKFGFDLEPKPVAYLGAGRPLGAHFDRDGNLIVCDALKGLVMVEAGSHAVRLLASHFTDPEGVERPITYANDLAIASDGTVYFTSSQTILPSLHPEGYWDTLRSYLLGLYSGEFKGRLLKWDPSSGKVTQLGEGYWYSNGVALAADESFVAFTETNRLRVLRYWLKGEKAGTVDVLVDRLPGFPDGIDESSDGGFWISLVAPIMRTWPYIKYTPLRTVLPHLPAILRPQVAPWGCVIKVSADGELLKMLMDSDGEVVHHVSSVNEHDGRLFLGNLVGNTLHVYDLAGLDAEKVEDVVSTDATEKRKGPNDLLLENLDEDEFET